MSDSLNRSEGKNMKIERFVLGPIETNCYVVVNEDTKECFAVDRHIVLRSMWIISGSRDIR